MEGRHGARFAWEGHRASVASLGVRLPAHCAHPHRSSFSLIDSEFLSKLHHVGMIDSLASGG